jgi:transcriptional regulator with XRE-family HTH domain
VPREPIPEAVVFGKTLRRLRDDRRLSQEKLSAAAHLTMNYLSDLERGIKVPSLTSILKLAYALDCPPADLLSEFSTAAIRRLFRQ